jgi:hypothetical protein
MTTISPMTRWLMAVLLVASCGSGDSESCGVGGVYLARLTQTGGNCPFGNSEQLINADGPSMPTPGCVTTQQSFNEAQCSSFVEDSCADQATGCQSVITGSYRFTDDGDRATGTLTFRVTCADGSACNATMAVAMTRQ